MLKKIQDIHANDETLWRNFQIYWNSGNYPVALNLLNNNPNLIRKFLNAEWLNKLLDYFAELQIDKDPSFKQDIIKVSIIPVGLNTGEVYFQITFNISNYVAMEFVLITAGNTTATITLPNNTYLIQYGVFVNQQLVQADVSRKNQVITYTLGEAIDKTAVCVAFRTKGTGWTRTTENHTATIENISYSGGTVIGVLCSVRDSQDSSLYHFIEANCTFATNYIQITKQANDSTSIFVDILCHNSLTFNVAKGLGNNTNKYVADLSILGEIAGFLATQNNTKVFADIAQNSNKIIFSTNEVVSPVIHCLASYN